MVRYGFGEQTEETEGGTRKFEHGAVDVTNKAFKYATEENPDMPPKQAVGMLLMGDQYHTIHERDVPVIRDELLEAAQEIDGVGEETAEQVVSAVLEAAGLA